MDTLGKLKLLLVEDNPLDAELAIRELRRSRMDSEWVRVDTEPRFREAVAGRPDAILSDFSMPHFDGLRALSIARECCPDVPFLFVSGTIGEENAIRALQNGAVDYVLKNNLIRLPAAVQRAVTEARERAARRAREAELSSARDRLAAILEATPDLVGTATPDGVLQYCNRAGLRMLGYVPDHDIAGLSISAHHPEWAATLMRDTAIPYAITHGTWSGETALLRKDNTTLAISQVVIAHRDADGNLAYLSTIARDITQFKANEARISRLNRMHSMLSGINNAIVHHRDRKSLFAATCRIAVENGGFMLAWTSLADGTGGLLPQACAGAAGLQQHGIDWLRDHPDGTTGLLSLALSSRRPAVCNDIASDPVAASWRDQALAEGCRSVVVLPLLVADKPLGTLAFYARESGLFDREELALVTQLAGDVSFALDLIAKDERLHYLAYYDPLTDLPNRRQYEERVGQRLADTGTDTLAVIMVKVERMNALRQSIGRRGSDDLLQKIAARLKVLLHDTDILARVAAEEFAIFTRGGDAAGVGQRMEQLLSQLHGIPFLVAGTEYTIACKTGIAVHGSDGNDADTLLRNAEAALRNAEETGETCQFYAPAYNIHVTEKLSLETRLRRALDEQQFVLHYQPKVELATGRIEGVEALIRWQDPQNGLVAPGKFIPVLEETGLILDVGKWALERAAAQYQDWKAAGLVPPRVAVNVAAVQLRKRDFVDTVADVLQRHGGAGHGLDLEITESMLMADIDDCIEKLKALRALGVNLALDDFGTGYSSLSYIAKLPISHLKIDRSFVDQMASDPDHMTIVSAIITLAHPLGMEVIAEGVETEDQARLLRLLRCRFAQGYLFSRPLPAEQLALRLEQPASTPGGFLPVPPGQPGRRL